MENQLVKVINESGLDKTKAQIILDNFSNYFEMASDWENKAKSIVITDISQRNEMKMAREGRLFLKQRRIDVEKKRKELGESALREKQTIDAIAKILTNLIIPIENELEQKEKFAEIKEAERIAELKEQRMLEIRPFAEFIPIGIDIALLNEESYQLLLKGAQMQYNAKVEADKKAEEIRIETERKYILHNSRKNELIPYWQYLRGDQVSIDFGEIPEESFRIILNEVKQAKAKAIEEADRINAENEKLRKEAEAKEKLLAQEREKARIAAEKAAREKAKLEAEIKAKKEADEKAKKEAEAKAIAEQKAKELAEEKAKLAPDKEKLNQWVDSMNIPGWTFKTDNADKVANEIIDKFMLFKTWAKKQIETL